MKCKFCGVEVVKGYIGGIEGLYDKRRIRKRCYEATWLERIPHECRNIIKYDETKQ